MAAVIGFLLTLLDLGLLLEFGLGLVDGRQVEHVLEGENNRNMTGFTILSRLEWTSWMIKYSNIFDIDISYRWLLSLKLAVAPKPVAVPKLDYHEEECSRFHSLHFGFLRPPPLSTATALSFPSSCRHRPEVSLGCLKEQGSSG